MRDIVCTLYSVYSSINHSTKVTKFYYQNIVLYSVNFEHSSDNVGSSEKINVSVNEITKTDVICDTYNYKH